MRQQEQQCLKFAQAEGYIVKEDAIFREIVSGKEQYRKRPVLVEILDYIERLPKKQYILIVTSMQRISRNKRNLSYYSKFLYTRGVLIDSLNCLSEQSFEDRMSKLLDSIFKWSERNVVVRLVKPKRDRSGVDHK
jgi:DNA invertase Pin-like site-specific DNA recombinase